jgi:hypothetical protein
MTELFWIVLLIIHAALFVLFYCLGKTVKKRLNSYPALALARTRRSEVHSSWPSGL